MGNRPIKKSQSPASSDVCDEEEPTKGGRLTSRGIGHQPGAAAPGLSRHEPGPGTGLPAGRAPRAPSSAAPAAPARRGTASLRQTRNSRGPEPAIPPFHTLSSAFSQRRSNAATSPPSVPRCPPFSHPAGFARSLAADTAAAPRGERPHGPPEVLPALRSGGARQGCSRPAAHSTHRRSCLPGPARPRRRLRSFPGYFRAGHRPAGPEPPARCSSGPPSFNPLGTSSVLTH